MALLTAVALRIAWVAYVNVDPNDGRGGDSLHYHNMARLLAEGVGYVNRVSHVPTAHWPPAFPAALAVLYKLFGFHLALAKGLNIAFAAVTVALTYVVGRRIFDRRVAFLGALVLAFFPGQIYFSTLVLTETMFGMVFMLVLLLTLLWTVQRSDAHWWQLLLIGVLVGIAAMVRAEGVFLVFVLVALWALLVRPWRRMARYALLLGLGAALAVAPWTVRNAIQFHQFIPLRTNATGVVARALDPEAVAPRIRKEQVTSSVAEGLTYQVTHPWEIPSLVSRRVARLYRNDSAGIRWILRGPKTVPGYEPLLTEEEASLWRGLADRYFFAAGAAALVAAAFSLVRRDRTCLLLVVVALSWTLLFGFITPDSRFHFTLGPVIAILAAAFAVSLWGWGALAWQRLLPATREPARE